MKILVHLHLYYHNQIDFFIKKLSNINNCEWDLIVTYSEYNKTSFEKIALIKKNAVFLKVDNIGYDIYPFFKVIKDINLDNYDYILKIHTKNFYNKIWYPKNYVYSGKNCRGYWWRNKLVNSLLGSKKIFTNNLEILYKNPKIGMIADKSYYIELDKNSTLTDIENFKHLKEKLNISYSDCKYFLAGTMFIIKASILSKIQNYDFHKSDFGNSAKTNISSTLAHAFERIFVSLVFDNGYEIYLQDNLKFKVQYYFYKINSNIFSIYDTNDKKHKILTFFGIKIKIKCI